MVKTINLAFEFYSNSSEAIYERCTKLSPPILKCSKESIQLEYTGNKNYTCTHSLELADKISGLEKNIKSCLALTETKEYKSQKTAKK